jgi:hypothetical protein
MVSARRETMYSEKELEDADYRVKMAKDDAIFFPRKVYPMPAVSTQDMLDNCTVNGCINSEKLRAFLVSKGYQS